MEPHRYGRGAGARDELVVLSRPLTGSEPEPHAGEGAARRAGADEPGVGGAGRLLELDLDLGEHPECLVLGVEQVLHAQEQADAFDPSLTPVRELARRMPDASESKLRGHLGRFGLGQEKADVKVASLSGGERAKLLFACITRDAPHVLLLDEPTNHLDIDSRQALIGAINAYRGAVILVTHDLHLVAACAERLWIVRDGGCHPFEGDLQDYRAEVLMSRRAEKKRGRATRPYPATRALLGDAIRAGADAVIGHHPHVVREIAFVEGRPIVFSLGNLLMRMVTGKPWTEYGMLARLRFDKAGSTAIDICPLRISGLEPVALTGDKRRLAFFHAKFSQLLHVGGMTSPGTRARLASFGPDGCAAVEATSTP